MSVEVKKVDQYGRIGLSKEWREKEVFVLEYPDHVKIIPKEKVDLTEFFDMAEIEVREFADYHKFKEEVLSKKHLGAKKST
jgi:hypothetical protein